MDIGTSKTAENKQIKGGQSMYRDYANRLARVFDEKVSVQEFVSSFTDALEMGLGYYEAQGYIQNKDIAIIMDECSNIESLQEAMNNKWQIEKLDEIIQQLRILKDNKQRIIQSE